jgi:hypothetical protein
MAVENETSEQPGLEKIGLKLNILVYFLRLWRGFYEYFPLGGGVKRDYAHECDVGPCFGSG